MSQRRLLFYNDSRHFYMYCYDPPISIDDARAPVDDLIGTQVDTLVYGSGPSSTVFHDTRVGEIWGRRFNEFDGLYAYQAAENINSLIDRGIDPLNLLIERAHEKGIEFFASLRMAISGDPAVDGVFNCQFKLDHPEYCLSHSLNFDFSIDEVRGERFALAEEYVERYDVDGLELDWAFDPIYFEAAEAVAKAPILSSYMGEIRQAVDKAAAAKGKPILLGARVLPTLEGNLAAGMDVPAWIGEGLLDFVVPNYYGYHDLDADYPFEWLVELAADPECKVYPSLQSRIQGDDPALQSRVNSLGEYPADKAHYYAGAAAYWDKGADGIYLPWFRFPHGSHHQLLSEIQDPDILREKPKHYVVRTRMEEAADRGYDAPLPVTLTTGEEAPGQIVPLYVAECDRQESALLRLRLMAVSPKDSLTVTLNGKPLPPPSKFQHVRYSYAWLEYNLPAGSLRRGVNEIGVALHARPPRLVGTVSVGGVELVLSHLTVMPEAD